MFSSRLPLSTLIEHCRSLRHMLEAGLTLDQAMKHQAKSGPSLLRPIAERMSARLARGEDFASALHPELKHFPPLYSTLTVVAENTGMFPEVLRDLEDFFTLQQRLWQQFRAMIAWPAFQFIAAVLVLALLIWILGIIEGIRGPSPISVFGLKGGRGAVIFLSIIGGVIVAIAGGYWFIRNVLQRGPWIDGLLLQVPVLGRCMRHFALSRFSMGMALTMEAGAPITDAARMSLYATNNCAFQASAETVVDHLAEGSTLTNALREAHLFPDDFLASVDSAEISGQEPEVFHRQAEIHNEEAARWLKRLTAAAGWLTWMLVAGFIIFFIISLAMQISGVYQQAFKDLGM